MSWHGQSVIFKYMHKSQSNSPTSEQLKLMKYLDDFDRQINNRKSSVALEEQLASLSKAYNQAQEKLLETQRALMTESVLLEKQRSVIDIYKYALNQELDEEGILYFLQQLEEDESNRQIYDDIVEIRTIISRKKLKGAKKLTQQEKLARELKKEVAKLNEDKSEILEENEMINNSMYELKLNNEQLRERMVQAETDLKAKEQQLKQVYHLLEQERVSNKKIKEENISSNITINQLKQKECELIVIKKRSIQIQKILKNKLNFLWGGKQKENVEINQFEMVQKGENVVEGLQKKIDQLLKYKSQFKKQKVNIQQGEFLKKEVTLLKLYLSEQALQLFKEFQLQKLECIETEIRNLAVLEKGRILKLEECERDVWKYRIQLIKQDDQMVQNASKFLSQTYKCKLITSKSERQSSNLIETVRPSQEPSCPILQSFQLNNVSQFDS